MKNFLRVLLIQSLGKKITLIVPHVFGNYYFNYAEVHHKVFHHNNSRDQERMSGLSYLQACLSLCFFHKLPQFFVKQIFNVEFLEKLDIELANCYFKVKNIFNLYEL